MRKLQFDGSVLRLRQTFLSGLPWILPALFLSAWWFIWSVHSTRLRVGLIGASVVSALVTIGNQNLWDDRLGWALPSPRFITWPVLAGVVTGLLPRLIFDVGSPWKPRLSTMLLDSSLGPIAEELIFRGLALWALCALLARLGFIKGRGQSVAVLSIAVLFAWCHIHRDPDPWHFAFRMGSGLCYGWLRLASGSTASPALMHGAHNFVIYEILRLTATANQR
jgi:membrane protease YdiL (CAAX protease family)